MRKIKDRPSHGLSVVITAITHPVRLYMLSRIQKEVGKRPQSHISLHLFSKAADLIAAFLFACNSAYYIKQKKKGRCKYVNVLSPDNGRQC